MKRIKRLQKKGLKMSALYGIKNKICFYKAWWGGKKKWIVNFILKSDYTGEDEISQFDTYKEAKNFVKNLF
jgi:hypothetical protein